jgi:hypothetical protein
MVSVAVAAVTSHGELMYMMMSRSSPVPRASAAGHHVVGRRVVDLHPEVIRSSKSLLYGLDSLTPYDVRSTNDGST